jgi:hypothetical protein
LSSEGASREEPAGREAGVKARVAAELRAYLFTSAYLFVWLAALLLYRDALLREAGLAALPFGLAAGKALVLGKFVLLGESLGAGSRVGARTLVHRIAYRALALLLVLLGLTLVEELVVGWLHGRSSGQTLAEAFGDAWREHAAGALLMLLVLVPFVAAKQVSLTLGPGGIRELLSTDTRRKG